MAQSRVALTARFIAVDLVGSFVYFPVWWYTAGLLRTGRYCAGKVRDTARSFGLAVWLKNLFVPMFGQYDIPGRVISFFMRLAAIIFYSIALLLLAVVMTALFVLWVVFPLFVAFELLVQIAGLARAV